MAQRQYFRVSDFSGGWNPDKSPLLIEENQASEVLNLRLDEVGSLVSRQGYRPFLSGDPITTVPIMGLGAWRDGKDPTNFAVLIAHESYLRHADEGSNLYNSLWPWNTTKNTYFTSVRDVLLASNGVNIPARYTGAAIGSLGIAKPTSAPTVTKVVGTLNGTYQYAYTYYDSLSGSEGNPSNAMSTTLATEGAQLSLVASPNNRENKVRIYRKDPNSALFFMTKEIPKGNTYTDSGDTTTGIPLLYDRDRPLAFERMAYFQGYTFGSIGSTIYWSKALDPDAWPYANSTEVPFEGNDSITALVSFQDTLLIFGLRNTLMLSGAGGNWSIRRLDVGLGATGQNAVVEINGALVFLSLEGLYQFPNFEPVAPQISRYLSGQPLANLRGGAGVYVPSERAVWFSIGSKTYTVHLPTMAVGTYSFSARAFLQGGGNGASDPLWISGKQLSRYGGFLDRGVDNLLRKIPIRWVSKTFQLSNPELVKYFRRVGAYATKGSTSIVSVSISDTNNRYSIPLSSTSAGGVITWGEFLWGADEWTDEGVDYFVGALPAQALMGRVMEVGIASDTDTKTEIIPPITFEYRESNRFIGG